MRKDLYLNIVVSGETSVIPGLGARIKKEVDENAYDEINVISTGDSLAF